MPMQARYVIGRDGIIVYADINAEYRQHPDPVRSCRFCVR
jgi:hypothetical protein